MKILLFTSVFIIVGFFVNIVHGQTKSNTWVLYGTDKNYFYFFDSTSIKPIGNNHYTCWIKTVPQPDSLASIQNTMIRLNNPLSKRMFGDKNNMNGYDNYVYTLNKIECDCAAEKIRYLTLVDYDETGSVLKTEESKEEDQIWQTTPPGTVGSTLVTKICR